MKKSVTITLYMSELVYDIQNKTYITGRSRNNGNNHEEVANMQANDDDENLNQVLRSIGNSFATLKTKLSEYIIGNATTANNEQISSNDNLTVGLTMPSNYNSSTVDTISTALHQYIVNTSIADWFIMTNKADATDYINMAAANMEHLREAINKRVRPQRTRTNTPGTGGTTPPEEEGTVIPKNIE